MRNLSEAKNRRDLAGRALFPGGAADLAAVADLPINPAIATLVYVPAQLRRGIRHRELVMPVSAFIQAVLFVLLNAVALFAAAGTVKILGFWVYVAIFAGVMVTSFACLDPGLLRERMRPGGQRPPLGLRLFSLVLILHWIVAGLDPGRFHWTDDGPVW